MSEEKEVYIQKTDDMDAFNYAIKILKLLESIENNPDVIDELSQLAPGMDWSKFSYQNSEEYSKEFHDQKSLVTAIDLYKKSRAAREDREKIRNTLISRIF